MIGSFEIQHDYLAIIEKSRELVFFLKKNGDIIFSSAAENQLSGFSKEEYLELNIRTIVHPEDLPDLENTLNRIVEQPDIPVNYRFRKINKIGGYHWIEGTLINLLEAESAGIMIAKFRDITEQKLAEEQQYSLLQELSKKNQELNQFVYIISHNMRTPVSNLIGLIDIFEEEQLDDYNRNILQLFKRATERLNETIFDLTQILSFKDNKGVKITAINFPNVYEKVYSSFKEQIEKLGICISPRFSCSHVMFNKSYLESILTNLLSNAIKYRSPHRLLEISISLDTDEQQNSVLVFSDNGIGIDLDTNQNELFGLHQRFHNHINGNGVGLFITKSQITSLGGSIELRSKVDEGTTFIITLKGL